MDTVRIFLAFPEELDPAPGGISFISGMEKEVHKLNNDPEFQGVKLVLKHWKISAHVGLNQDGPQGQIDPLISNSDILIFAIGHSIGKGMKHEIEDALTRKTQQLKAFFYPEGPLLTKNESEAQNAVAYYKTINELWCQGLAGKYRNTEHLIHMVCENLREYIRQILNSRPLKHGVDIEDISKLVDDFKVLVGREKNLQELTERLSFRYLRCISILGIGGIGKTTLVRRLLHDAKAAGKIINLVWIDLITPYNDLESLMDFCLSKFTNSLNVDIHVKDSTQSKIKVFLSRIRQITEPSAVVFDNLEKIMDNKAFVQEIRELVLGLPENFKTFLISQQDTSFFKSPEIAQPFKIGALSREDSEILINQKLEKHDGHTLTQDEITKICSFSSGIPLLIEWMVEIALCNSHNDDALDLLYGTIPETFEKSVQRMLAGMDDATRKVWDYISVASKARYHLQSDAIKALCGSISSQNILTRLASYPLITSRNGYITTIEALSIIEAKLHPATAEEVMQDQIAAYYLGVASIYLKLPLESYEKTDYYRELLKDKDNFIRAIEYYIEKSKMSLDPLGYRYRLCLYQFACGISWFLWVNGFIAQRIGYLTEAIEISIKHEEEPEKCLANINDVAWTHYHLRELNKAEHVLTHLDKPMLQIVQKSNIRYKAMIDRLRANILIAAPKAGHDPVPLLNQALKVFSDIGERRRVASVHSELGYYYYTHGKYQQAHEAYELALNIALEIGEKHSLPIFYWRVGEVLISLYKKNNDIKQIELAISILEKGLEASKVFRKQGEAHIRVCLAEAFYLSTQTEQDERLIRENLIEAEKIFQDIGDTVGLSSIAKLKQTIYGVE